MMTKRPWFGPKRFGWGWRPVSWQGWLVTVLFAAVVVWASIAFRASPTSLFVDAGAVVGLVVVCFLTGTRPG